jgi:spermidine synthase
MSRDLVPLFLLQACDPVIPYREHKPERDVADKTSRHLGTGARSALLLTAFISGFCILGLELLGFRIFAPTFGYSTYVSAGIVGSVLFVLSIGYMLGGSLADRYPNPALLYKIILAAGIYLFPMLLLYKKIMDFAFQNLGTIAGSVTAALLIYAVPMILLSMVGPFVIKLLAMQTDVGRTAGKVFFISTIGSLLGTFLTPLVLIYFFGSHVTFIILSATVLLMAIAGMLPFNFMFVITAALFGLIPVSFSGQSEYLDHLKYGGQTQIEKLTYEKESFYNLLRVVEEKTFEDGSLVDTKYRLSVNLWTSYSVSVSARNGYLTDSYYDYFAVVPMLTEGKDILILGMGTGTSVKQFEHFYPEARIDAVEIDPEIIRIAAEKWFDVHETDRIRIFPLDARPFLSKTDKKYDVIELDMFQGGPDIPFYVTTLEFYRMIHDHLKPGGVLTMNVLQLDMDKRLAGSVGKTLREVFPSLYEANLSTNVILVAFKEDKSLREINARLEEERLKHPGLERMAGNLKLREFTSYPGSQVFTDDKANIEILTFSMVERGLEARRNREAKRRERVRKHLEQLKSGG